MTETKRRLRRPNRSVAHWVAALVLISFALFFSVSSVGASHHVPGEADPNLPDAAFEIYTHGRLFYSFDLLSGMLEYAGRFEDGNMEFRYQSVTIGGYYRLHRNVKAGAFYRLQFNVRHDDDWIEEGTSWLWADAAGRAEHILMADFTPRFQLSFLPGKNWLFSVKNRYEYNVNRAEHSLLVRPGLTYFLIRDREPVLNLSLQYATYLSLNFGAVPWYRHGPYFNVLYHLSPNLQIDIGASRQSIYWSESDQFLADFPTSTYADNIYSPWVVDVGFIIRLN